MANFGTLPVDRIVSEGNSTTFECAANDGGSQNYTVFWRLRRENTTDVFATIATNITLDGTEGVTVGPNGSPLTLTSVSRSLNSISVSCVAIINFGTSDEQDEPPANLNVTCELLG